MSIEYCMPSLGADMEAATLVEWKIKPGDIVKRGDVVAVVETDKGAIDIEIYESGCVERLLVAPDTRVLVGAPLALIAGEPAAATTSAVPTAPALEPESKPEPAPTVAPAMHGHVKISPAARTRAHALNIDIDKVHGSGPGGVVTLQDIESAATKPKPSASDSMKAVIAAAMARSKREIPHYYLSTDVDYSATMTWLTRRNAELPIEQRMLPIVPLLRAIVLALKTTPDFNGYFKDNTYKPSDAIHLGVAIAQRGGGLIVPALLDAQDQTLAQLTGNLRDLVNRVRAGRLNNRELSEGTITLTSLGDGGVDSLSPVIYPPQVAIIGAGTVRERAWASEGKIDARPVLTLSLAADHRVSNGRSGAQFLARIRDYLQAPEKL
ncbi:MAG TPA: dihydrolipoamide acetyltransferase family protein [Tepidisphaeraceae bacterium]|nr:dihydrolipoamide acetyltransferase family protein [Tepidisphaeraceae bacterium]